MQNKKACKNLMKKVIDTAINEGIKRSSKPRITDNAKAFLKDPYGKDRESKDFTKKQQQSLSLPCTCSLLPKHQLAEHDACCQICGGAHTERICPNKNKKKRVSNPRIFVAKIAKCVNPQCCFYRSRHRHYFWISQTKQAKPSCPKCFSHRTEIVSKQEFVQ